ncbi:MAG: ATP-binding protein [Pseudomonadota bacterium]
MKPAFWREATVAGAGGVNYRRLWKLTLGTALAVSLLPLLLLTLVALNQFDRHDDMQRQEMREQIERMLSNTRLQIADFLGEHRAALAFVVQENGPAQLADHRQLNRIFLSLRRSFGGFVDLGLIDAKGEQRAYVGPHALLGHNYRDEDWFKEALIRGVYISDVFLGHRSVPHFVIVVKHEQEDGGYHMLRATVNITRIQDMLAKIARPPYSDAFLVNQAGFLQTPSRFYGGTLEVFPLPRPRDLKKSVEVTSLEDPQRGEQLSGFAQVEGTPFTVVLIKRPEVLLGRGNLSRVGLLALLGASGLFIAGVIFYGATGLVNRLYLAERSRDLALHERQNTSKLDSLGRLAAGVAHEITDPISVINEKAGLLRDLLPSLEASPAKDRFQRNVDSILGAVRRVGAITNRLLGLARHLDVQVESIHLEGLLREVLGFLDSEARYRQIEITLDFPPDLPAIESDAGQVQQVFLNIINNALAAMSGGGSIHITARQDSPRSLAVSLADDGQSIPPEHLERIFEPFFAARGEQWGTGLGLSITQGMVRGLGGRLEVSSQEGQGTTFTVILPLTGQG